MSGNLSGLSEGMVPMTEQTDQVDYQPVTTKQERMRRPPYILIGSAALLILCGLISFVAFNVFKGTRSSPIAFEQYPGSQLVREKNDAFSDQKLFSTTASVQDVYSFYVERFPKSSDDTNGCKKIYTDQPPSEEPGHWFGRCVLDNSMLDVSQRLTITINYQPLDGSSEPRTYYGVERQWGNQ
jgi:hypothetical protein